MLRAIKNEKQLLKRLKFLKEQHDKLFFAKAVIAVNTYLVHNREGIDMSEKTAYEISKITDDVCLSGAWIYDRMQNKICKTHSSDYRGSLTKKIRKALGFTL